MNKTELLLFDVIKAALLNRKVDLSKETKNEDLISLAREQTFLAYLYYSSKEDAFKNFYISSYLIHEQFEKIKGNVKKLFDQANIAHIFLKGSQLQYLYPDNNLRMLGDIDLLVNEEDLNKAVEILKSNKFILHERADHHIAFRYGQIEFELHHRIIEISHPLYDFFKNPFDHVNKIDNYTYHLEDNYNFIFILSHYMKHLKKGSGIRSLCDLYLMIKKLNIDLDYAYSIFKKYGYQDFFNCALNALNYLFELDLPYYSNYSQDLIQYSLLSGIHGYGEKNNSDKNNQLSTNNNKFIYLWNVMFVPLPTLFSYYPWTKSIILIPFGYVARFFHLVFKRKKALKRVLRNSKNDDTLFKNIGLKNE